ncbi:MAG: hypothetical protein QG635_1363, partial [Bacteroidota bacterium]|nr:hypothetical protein [Bacteroidota bacterium]
LRDSVKPGVSGLLYEYGNIGQLSGKLLDIINDNEKRENLSKGAVEFASSFSWDESARMMLEVCEMTIKDFNK